MDSKYIESTEGGAYRGRNHDVFLVSGGPYHPAVQGGWPSPSNSDGASRGHTMENIIAHIDADNALEHQLDNLDGYQDYEVVSLTSRIALTENVIADVLNGDSELRSIYQKSLKHGIRRLWFGRTSSVQQRFLRHHHLFIEAGYL